MTSLERRTNTRDGSRIPFLAMSSALFSVARETVAPASSQGSRIPIGVSLPVRPTCQTTSCSSVETSSASNL